MRMVSKVAAVVQAVLDEMAEEANKETFAVKRIRKFSPSTLAQTFVLGFLMNPRATDEELAQTAGLLGVNVTVQAVEQRHTVCLAQFLQLLFRGAANRLVKSRKSMAPLLDRFPAVVILDSSTIVLPDELRALFPGCGGSYGFGQAAMKVQLRWDLKSGELNVIEIESGRSCDYKTPVQLAALPKGSLRIADLGYFDTEVLQQFNQNEILWLSRLQFGTNVYTPDGQLLSVLDWLGRQSGPVVDEKILIGTKRKVACRLVAFRVPQEVANRRRQKLIAEMRRKNGHTPSKARLAWCDWTILVTNAEADVLTPKEIAVLYRARWQIELVFKRWKSLGLIAELTGKTLERKLIALWSRLLAVLIQHWVMLCCVWGDVRYSFVKVWKTIRDHTKLLAHAIDDRAKLEAVIETLVGVLRSTARRNKRKRSSTFELLNNPDLLGYG